MQKILKNVFEPDRLPEDVPSYLSAPQLLVARGWRSFE